MALPEEPRATCPSCAMAPKAGDDAEDPRFFSPDARCCTYHPRLPNFLVGRALRDGGTSAEVMRRRLALGGGISAEGVAPDKAWFERYQEVGRAGFGRALSIRCPYWVGGDFACGIWQNRGAVCRSWHCRYAAGPAGLRVWEATKLVLQLVEGSLQAHCLAVGARPGAKASSKTWEAWFVWCADEIDRVSADPSRLPTDDRLLVARRALAEAVGKLTPPMPERLRPAVSDMRVLESGRVVLFAYSARDWVEADRGIFQFLSRLDGETPWREALAAAQAAGAAVDEALVHELWRVRALRAPEAGDVPPEGEHDLPERP